MMTQPLRHNLPIGIFDSGVGGLTVLNELTKSLPGESFLYLGDTARLPYGTKSLGTVREYAKQMATALVKYRIKLLVVACNTATAASIPYLQKLFPDLPIIGVVAPSAKAALSATSNNNIAVLATQTTINSSIYQNTIQSLRADAQVVTQSCGLLVALAEEGHIDDDIATLVLKKYIHKVLAHSVKVDCLLLGCTHFPVFTRLFKRILGDSITIIDSAKETAIAVTSTLEGLNIKSKQEYGSLRFWVTDSPERFIKTSQLFLDKHIDARFVSLIDVKESADVGAFFTEALIDA